MRGEILGIERRRRWDDEGKLAIVSAVGVDGATVTQIAQRHDLSRQQIYGWRRELKQKGLWSPDLGALFLPVGAAPPLGTALGESTSLDSVDRTSSGQGAHAAVRKQH